MKLGFYYHTPIQATDGGLALPSYLGVFLQSLGDVLDELVLFMNEAEDYNPIQADFVLKGTTIRWVNLGPKKAAWQRSLFSSSLLSTIRAQTNELDALLVRGPSPLAPYLVQVQDVLPVFYLVVGDYGESVDQGTGRGFRSRIVDLYLKWNQMVFDKSLGDANGVLVNSQALFEKYKNLGAKLSQVRTTTLKKADIQSRIDSIEENLDSPIRLLFTGRINWQKGLRELVQAVVALKDTPCYPELHIVGWEDDSKKPVEKELLQMAIEGGIADRVFFHGKKSVGAELFAFYQMAHIYVLPTYHEGFPRTIWEAMANGTPVITTSVGSIPYFLTDQVDSLLLKPKDVKGLVRAIEKLSSDKEFRRRIIRQGLALAESNTLEEQTGKLVAIIRDNVR